MRLDSVQWHGPGFVIGQVDQQVFIKHGSFYVRVHPCRIQLKRGASRTVTDHSSNPKLDSSSQTDLEGQTSIKQAVNLRDESTEAMSPLLSERSSNLNYNLEATEANNRSGSIEVAENSPLMPSSRSTLASEPDSNCCERGSSISSVENPPSDNIINCPDSSSGSFPPSEDSHENGTSNSDHASNLRRVARSNVENTNKSSKHAIKSIKPGDKIQYEEWENHPTTRAVIISRAGKATGKHSGWWNTINESGEQRAVDLNKVHSWDFQQNLSSQPADSLELQTDPVLVITNKQRQTKAKNAELQQWKDMSVYQEVDDVGQECISLRWG